MRAVRSGGDLQIISFQYSHITLLSLGDKAFDGKI